MRRDDLRHSGACRWGCVDWLKLYLSRGEDALNADAEPVVPHRAAWPRSERAEVLAVLRHDALNILRCEREPEPTLYSRCFAPISVRDVSGPYPAQFS